MRATMTITGRLFIGAACLVAAATAGVAGATTSANRPSNSTQFSAVETAISSTLSTKASAAFGGTNVTPNGDFVIHVVGGASSIRAVKALVAQTLASLPPDEGPIPPSQVIYVSAHVSLAGMMRDESLITEHRDALAALGVQVTSYGPSVLTSTFDIAVTQLTPAGRRAIEAIIGSHHMSITSIVLPGPLNRPVYSSGARGSGGSSQVRTGVLTGTAADCDSGANEAAAARSQVLVEAYSTKTADRFGANERIIDGHAYRFVLPAGTYQVTDSWLSEQLYLGPPITVRSGRVTHADLVSEICPP